MRSPEELREDKSVFMNQGEWELLHILSNYTIFSVDNDDYYAEMKFRVSILNDDKDFKFQFMCSANVGLCIFLYPFSLVPWPQ